MFLVAALAQRLAGTLALPTGSLGGLAAVLAFLPHLLVAREVGYVVGVAEEDEAVARLEACFRSGMEEILTIFAVNGNDEKLGFRLGFDLGEIGANQRGIFRDVHFGDLNAHAAELGVEIPEGAVVG